MIRKVAGPSHWGMAAFLDDCGRWYMITSTQPPLVGPHEYAVVVH